MCQIIQQNQAIELAGFDERIVCRGDFHTLLAPEEQCILIPIIKGRILRSASLLSI